MMIVSRNRRLILGNGIKMRNMAGYSGNPAARLFVAGTPARFTRSWFVPFLRCEAPPYTSDSISRDSVILEVLLRGLQVVVA